MPITTADFNDVVKNAKYEWSNAEAEMPEVRSQLAVVKSVTDKTSDHSSISSFPTARRRTDAGNAQKGAPKQGYAKSFNQAEIALEADISKQLRKFDKYDEIMRRIRGLKQSITRRQEQDVAGMLSYAWSTSYTNIDGETVTTSTPDGLALISASHVPNGSATTWSNQLTGNHAPISPTTLENLEQLFNNFLDDGDGRAVPRTATHIITGQHAPTVHEVRRILNSQLLPGTENNDTNTFKSAYQHIIVPYLDFNLATEARDSTKSKYVFLANLMSDINCFRVEQSQAAELEAPFQVTESGIWQWVATALYDYGTLGANFISGTKGDGSAI